MAEDGCMPESTPDGEVPEPSAPRMLTPEESLDWAVEHGVSVGPHRGLCLVNQGPLQDAAEDSPDSRPSIALWLWRPDPGGEETHKLLTGRTNLHDGKVFLHFALSEEAGEALLKKLAEAYRMDLVFRPDTIVSVSPTT